MDNRRDGAPAWSPAPEGNVGRNYPIYTPKVGKDVNVIVLSECIVGVYTHYFDQRTRPCMGSRELCAGCDMRISRRWKGYLACWDKPRGRLVLAEVTHECYLRCPAFEAYKGALRGKTLTLTRNGNAKNSRVSARVAMWAGPIEQLPPAFNVESALERIWWADDNPDGQTSKRPDPTPPENPQDVLQIELFRQEGPYCG